MPPRRRAANEIPIEEAYARDHMTRLEQQMEMLMQQFQAFMANQNHQNHNAHDAGDDFEESDDSQEAPRRRRRVLDPPIEDRRWWEAGFTFVIKHKEGVTNRVADALSRRSMLLTTIRVDEPRFDSFRDLLDTDPYFSVIMAAVRVVNWSSGFSPFQVVYSMIPHGPLDLIPLPSKIRAHGKAAEFVDGLQAIQKKVHDNLVQVATKYKMLTDKKRRHVEFKVGDFVWAVLIKD
ncbi:hypothetical protein MRB53_016097 [Persea americana]|uniref:Uncharacterized protein n=1 Tax=Persea americana TaxID=3435 RepID=A0ACC2M1T3_PERAE|nr:hypothetical protein MRB53_016097 [Persea americana]